MQATVKNGMNGILFKLLYCPWNHDSNYTHLPDRGWTFLLWISSQSSQFYLPPEKLTQKKRSNFEKLQFWNDKIDLYTNFAKLPSAKWLFFYNCKFYQSRIEEEKIHLDFCVSVFVVRGKSERIERKFETQKSWQSDFLLLVWCG